MSRDQAQAAPLDPGGLRRLARLSRGILRNPFAHGASVSLLLTVAAAGFSLLMLLVLARTMSGEEFGRFAIWFSVASLLTVAAGRGQEMMIVRSWNESLHAGRTGEAGLALRFGLGRTLTGAAVTAAGLAAACAALSLEPGLIAGLALFLILQTLSLYVSQATRVVVGVAPALIFRNILWRVAVLAAAPLSLQAGRPFTARDVFLVASAAIAAGLALQAARIWRRMPAEARRPAGRDVPGEWCGRSRRLWLAAMLEACNQYLDVVVIGLVLNPVAAGAYFAASRLAALFYVLAEGINAYVSKLIPELYYQGRRSELAELLRRTSMSSALLVAVGLAIVVGGGDLLLSAFGRTLEGQRDVLLILCVGTAFVAFAGPAPSLLLLTGGERRYTATVAAFSVVRYVAVTVGALLFGLVGVAAATAGSLIAAALVTNHHCRRSVGIDPSLLSAIGRFGGSVVRRGAGAPAER